MGGSTSKSKEQEIRASSRSGGDGAAAAAAGSRQANNDDMCTANFFKLVEIPEMGKNSRDDTTCFDCALRICPFLGVLRSIHKGMEAVRVAESLCVLLFL